MPAITLRPPAEKLTMTDRIWHKHLGRPYRLHIIDHGGSGPVLILLHGLASSSANWQELIPLLKQDYRCIGIDLIGFGESPKPQWYDYTLEQHLLNVEAAIRRLHLRQPFTLLGHSLGSLLATRYARQHQHKVKRLVLLSPPVYAPLDTIGSRLARQRTSLYLRAYRYLRTHPRVTPESFQRVTSILPQTKSLIVNTEMWRPLTRSLEQCIENQTLIADIREVQAPVEIFYGLFDEVVVPYNVRQLARIRDVTLYPLRVNHIVGRRYAVAVAKILAPAQVTARRSKRRRPGGRLSQQTPPKPSRSSRRTSTRGQTG